MASQAPLNPTPQPPADGEVEYALLELRSLVMGLGYAGMHVDAGRLERAADLLSRSTPQPVAVSERLPGAKDCMAGECWAWDTAAESWNRTHYALCNHFTHWLPFNALPLPQGHGI